MMYVTIFCNIPIYLKILFYLATNFELSGEINVEVCIIEKKQENPRQKNCKLIFSDTLKYKKIFLITTQFNE